MITLLTAALWACLQDDVADVPSEERRAGGDERKRYFLLGPMPGDPEPRGGRGLVLILPGGDGSADFLPFVKRIYQNALREGYLAAHLVAPRWTEDQRIVWPTRESSVEGMEFTTEEFADAVIEEVVRDCAIDREKVFTLSWSSSGPAAYAISLRSSQVTGSFIAMSVFHERTLPDLDQARGKAYYLYHSPDDRTCPIRMAHEARDRLQAVGARVEFAEYEGGHGWRGNVYGAIRRGIDWLDAPG